MKQITIPWPIAVLWLILLIVAIFDVRYSFRENNDRAVLFSSISEEIVRKSNLTYKQTLKNYYDVEYNSDGKVFTIRIDNPCITLRESTGNSMKPYWDNKTLLILDTCYPPENLKIGDVIVYDGELDSTINVHHRIADIDYKKRWVKTKGDNNSIADDFVGFDRIMGKDIGVLNVLEPKKMVKEELVNDSVLISELTFGRIERIEQFCVCSSKRLLTICSTNKSEMIQDDFVRRSNLREEYCKKNET